jgi:hypothetical protein
LFKRTHHRAIASILESLDAQLLYDHRCYFGGGTSIVLQRNEYRESVDIDFLVSDLDGYRELRQRVMGAGGINALTTRPVQVQRDIRADQYGIRTVVGAGGSPVKFEIIHEGRIALDYPSAGDTVCGVSTLSELDAAASKLLANADRWADRSVHYRDIIDLAMLAPASSVLDAAIQKASRAYGDSITRCLSSVIDHLAENPSRLSDAIEKLQLSVPYAEMWPRIEALRTA